MWALVPSLLVLMPAFLFHRFAGRDFPGSAALTESLVGTLLVVPFGNFRWKSGQHFHEMV
jgi:hypothetical protein